MNQWNRCYSNSYCCLKKPSAYQSQKSFNITWSHLNYVEMALFCFIVSVLFSFSIIYNDFVSIYIKHFVLTSKMKCNGTSESNSEKCLGFFFLVCFGLVSFVFGFVWGLFFFLVFPFGCSWGFNSEKNRDQTSQLEFLTEEKLQIFKQWKYLTFEFRVLDRHNW